MEPCIGSRFEELDSIDSTNLYAMQQIHAGKARPGDAFFAHAQVAGRGQRGKTWWSAAGQNIALSVVLDTTKLASSQRFRLVATMALGVLDWLQSIHPGDWKTKWPNDLYHDDRKAGGMLIENLQKGGRWTHAVVGIGINMNQHSFPGHLPNPVSIFMISRKRHRCADEARSICQFLDNRWKQLMEGGWTRILEDYNENLYGKDKICRIKKDSAVIPCLVKSVNEQGQLIAGENNEWAFEFGEVSWVV
ncbi:MAG: biotin--[acetyl-CoA-carboxylase] ligase [Chitinophagaceae bacterium]|jgi:BirA family biotin operon repressor/biotin-[acetyl-CoA-carboxylase] ligase|nr:biotin--[acetyl-CoA-carboxylase] ligase [Chitinophagaceae bacterium]MCU0404157.1 biotin--[acetyl-CoA-carboxylase] ligase [Chitinophagaceae bacterium]